MVIRLPSGNLTVCKLTTAIETVDVALENADFPMVTVVNDQFSDEESDIWRHSPELFGQIHMLCILCVQQPPYMWSLDVVGNLEKKR